MSDKDRAKRLLGAQSADIDALLALTGDALMQVTPTRIGEDRAAVARSHEEGRGARTQEARTQEARTHSLAADERIDECAGVLEVCGARRAADAAQGAGMRAYTVGLPMGPTAVASGFGWHRRGRAC